MAEATPSGREGLLAGMTRFSGRGRLTGDGSPYLGNGLFWVGMSVPAHPRGSVGLLASGQWTRALGGNDTYGYGWKRAAHRGRFALPWCGPVAGRDERPRSSAVGPWACLRLGNGRGLWEVMIRMGMAGRGRLTGDGSPYLGAGLLQVGMSVPAHPPLGLAITGASKRIPNHDRVGTGFVSQDCS